MAHGTSPRYRVHFLLLFPLLAVACASPRSGIPENREIYREAALREDRNPVVVVHGLLGSRLMDRESGKIVWGAFTSDAIDPKTAEGVRLLAVPLTSGSALDYDPETSAVYPDGPLDTLDISLLFQVFSVDIYAGILRSLGVGGYRDSLVQDPNAPEYADDHYTCHTFFYDWRRDNVENAIAFGRFLGETRTLIDKTARAKIARLESAGGHEDLETARELREWLDGGYKFDIVAHSMGGLITRYYLRYGIQDLPEDGSLPEVTWAGAEQIDRVVMVGTPNLGSMDALDNLVNGYNPSIFLPYYHPAVLGLMPAIYQLLPRNANRLFVDQDGATLDVDLFDPATWQRHGWGLMAEDADDTLAWVFPEAPDRSSRHSIARDYLDWCLERARRFNEALDQVPTMPCPVLMRLFASDTVATKAKARLVPGSNGRLVVRLHDADLSDRGDGTVPRYSAVGDLRYGRGVMTWLDSTVPWETVTFLPDDHIGLTRNPVFTNNLLFFLLEQRPR